MIYNPLRLAKDHKNNTTEHIISTATKLLKSFPNAKLVITGDFNDLDTTQISTLLRLHQIDYFSSRGDAKLDLIYTYVDEYVTSGRLHFPPILTNDHSAVEVPSTCRRTQPRYTTFDKREITPANKIALTKELSSLDWSDVFTSKTVNQKAEKFHETVNEIFDKHCPIRKVRVATQKASAHQSADQETATCKEACPSTEKSCMEIIFKDCM